MRKVALVVILLNLAVSILHGIAHQTLGVGLSHAQTLFVVVVIAAGPVLAAFLLRLRFDSSGPMVLLLVMAASLIFGIWNHYVAMSPDHVSQVSALPNKLWSHIFQITAALLAVLETIGAWMAVKLLRR